MLLIDWLHSFQHLEQIVFPAECVWCECPVLFPQRVCSACQKLLVHDYHRCRRCASPLPNVVPVEDCFRCRNSDWQLASVQALGPYRDDLRKAVILIKKRSYEPLRRSLAELLAHRLLNSAEHWNHSEHPPVLMPVPNHWTRKFSGVAPTANLLTQHLADLTGWPMVTGKVRRIRKTRKQGLLSWTERRKNVRGAFEIVGAKTQDRRHVLLVDDVLTSGSTTNEIARVLKKGYALSVTAAVIARGTGARETQLKFSTDLDSSPDSLHNH
ncbi:MAG: ComF family protein [Planctomycetales bacterium]|nr:ComF family protein [Planctomycetales bacterium]